MNDSQLKSPDLLRYYSRSAPQLTNQRCKKVALGPKSIVRGGLKYPVKSESHQKEKRKMPVYRYSSAACPRGMQKPVLYRLGFARLGP